MLLNKRIVSSVYTGTDGSFTSLRNSVTLLLHNNRRYLASFAIITGKRLEKELEILQTKLLDLIDLLPTTKGSNIHIPDSVLAKLKAKTIANAKYTDINYKARRTTDTIAIIDSAVKPYVTSIGVSSGLDGQQQVIAAYDALVEQKAIVDKWVGYYTKGIALKYYDTLPEYSKAINNGFLTSLDIGESTSESSRDRLDLLLSARSLLIESSGIARDTNALSSSYLLNIANSVCISDKAATGYWPFKPTATGAQMHIGSSPGFDLNELAGVSVVDKVSLIGNKIQGEQLSTITSIDFKIIEMATVTYTETTVTIPLGTYIGHAAIASAIAAALPLGLDYVITDDLKGAFISNTGTHYMAVVADGSSASIALLQLLGFNAYNKVSGSYVFADTVKAIIEATTSEALIEIVDEEAFSGESCSLVNDGTGGLAVVLDKQINQDMVGATLVLTDPWFVDLKIELVDPTNTYINASGEVVTSDSSSGTSVAAGIGANSTLLNTHSEYLTGGSWYIQTEKMKLSMSNPQAYNSLVIGNTSMIELVGTTLLARTYTGDIGKDCDTVGINPGDVVTGELTGKVVSTDGQLVTLDVTTAQDAEIAIALAEWESMPTTTSLGDIPSLPLLKKNVWGEIDIATAMAILTNYGAEITTCLASIANLPDKDKDIGSIIDTMDENGYTTAALKLRQSDFSGFYGLDESEASLDTNVLIAAGNELDTAAGSDEYDSPYSELEDTSILIDEEDFYER